MGVPTLRMSASGDGALPPAYSQIEDEEVKEVTIDLSANEGHSDMGGEELPPPPDAITISVTDGATVVATFQYPAPPELSILDLRAGLCEQLRRIDPEKKIRLLIFRGQILKYNQKVGDTKMQPGDTLQMLTAANTPPPEAPTAEPASASPRGVPAARTLLMQLGMMQQTQQDPRGPVDPALPQITLQGLELQEEVERWASRVKVWTCMLLLLYSFKLLVGLSQSLETRQQHYTPTLAFSVLAFWVAYVGARAATRLNLALARGYFYGQVLVAVVNIFLLAVRDPSQINPDTKDEIPASIVWITLAINCLFWGYIVYGAYRFQRALFLWLSEVHP